MAEKTTYRMKVVPEPTEPAAVIHKTTPGPHFIGKGTGKGPRTYQCGSCGNTLARNINRNQIIGVILQCKCGACNVIPPSHQTH